MTAPATVGIVVVSHSAKVAEGTVEMARAMVGDEVRVVGCGGDPAGGLGTDPTAITRAIEDVWGEAGVVVLVDLGGASMNAEMAVETLEPTRAARVRVCDAPLVEGAVVAAAEASGGAGLDEVCAAALAVKR